MSHVGRSDSVAKAEQCPRLSYCERAVHGVSVATVIAQLLNREFLLDAADVIRTDLLDAAELMARREDVGPLRDLNLTPEQVQAAVQELGRVLAEEPIEGLAQAAPGEAPSEVLPKDDFAYMPREPMLAILQTVIENVAEEQRPDAIESGGPEDERRSGGGQAVLADRQFAGLELPRREDGRRAWGRFEVTKPKIFSDPRWVLSGVVILWHRFKNDRAQFGGLPDGPIDIADDARILVVGDWGSGTKRARKVADQMRAELDRGAGREQHVIHLGDVYYTGSKKQYERHFLANWPVRNGEHIGSYALVGNHDMYEGGHAYYETCLTDPRFSRQDGHSVFALRSSAWQFFALDSSYDDKALYGGQASWILDQLDQNPRHRTALLSHHQLFSAYESGAAQMGLDIEPVLQTGRVDAWFWAHEHRCLTYQAHRGVGFSSCVGHGGIPEYLVKMDPDKLLAPLKYDYRKKFGDGIEPWNTLGFAVLELNGRSIQVRYVDENGNQNHTEDLTV
jgi:hypothetical protein